MSSYLTRHIAHSSSEELGLLSPYFFSFLINFSSGRYRSKCLRSFISLEFIPRLDDIVNPNILPRTTNMTTPTTTNAMRVVSENSMLKTTNSTIKGLAVKLIVIVLDGYRLSFYLIFGGDFDTKSFILLLSFLLLPLPLVLFSSFSLLDLFFFCEYILNVIA